MDQNKLCSEILGLYQEDRHDFLNHLQVILGYLQLNKEERAISYIKQTYQEMQEISTITKLKNPYLVVALLLMLQKSKHLDIKLSFQMEQGLATLQRYQENITDQLSVILDRILDFLHDNFTAHELRVEVAFHESDGHLIWIIGCPPGLALKTMVGEWHNHPELAYLKAEGYRIEISEPESKLTVYHALNVHTAKE